MTAEQLAHWILSLPEDIRQGVVTGVVHGHPHTAKRAVAFRSANFSWKGIYIEPMGTHAELPNGTTFPSNISHFGKITTN